jgi:hypothetical protein
MKGLYVVIGVISGIAGVGSIIYGLTQGGHGSSAITSGIIMLVVAASTVYAIRGRRQGMSGVTASSSDVSPPGGGREQGATPRQVYILGGLTVVFVIVAFAIADAIGAPTTGPGPPAVIVLIGATVACLVYGLVAKARAHADGHPHVR